MPLRARHNGAVLLSECALRLLLPILCVIAAMASFQAGAAVAKGLFPAVGALGAATLRLALGALMLAAIARPWKNWPRAAPLWPVLGLGISVTGAMVFFFLAIERLPLGVAIAIQFLGPLAIALSHSRRVLDLAWAVLAAVGVWCLVGSDASVASMNVAGVGFALAAAVSWAGYILFGRVASAHYGSATAALSVSIAAFIMLPIGAQQVGFALLDTSLLPLALAVAVLSVALPFSLELYAIPRMPARTFAVFMSLEPAFGVLSGLFILGEQLGLVQISGILAVMGGAAGSAWSSAEAGAGQADQPVKSA
jgi:inner membrane transporter RhtA